MKLKTDETDCNRTPQSDRTPFWPKGKARREAGLSAMAGGGGPVVMFCSAGSSENAEQIANALISERVAACVQISPINSIYRWEGAVRHNSEFSLQIKTSFERVSEVERVIMRIHTYELPEIIVLPIIGGSPGYLGWLADSVQPL